MDRLLSNKIGKTEEFQECARQLSDHYKEKTDSDLKARDLLRYPNSYSHLYNLFGVLIKHDVLKAEKWLIKPAVFALCNLGPTNIWKQEISLTGKWSQQLEDRYNVVKLALRKDGELWRPYIYNEIIDELDNKLWEPARIIPFVERLLKDNYWPDLAKPVARVVCEGKNLRNVFKALAIFRSYMKEDSPHKQQAEEVLEGMRHHRNFTTRVRARLFERTL